MKTSILCRFTQRAQRLSSVDWLSGRHRLVSTERLSIADAGLRPATGQHLTVGSWRWRRMVVLVHFVPARTEQSAHKAGALRTSGFLHLRSAPPPPSSCVASGLRASRRPAARRSHNPSGVLWTLCSAGGRLGGSSRRRLAVEQTDIVQAGLLHHWQGAAEADYFQKDRQVYCTDLFAVVAAETAVDQREG